MPGTDPYYHEGMYDGLRGLEAYWRERDGIPENYKELRDLPWPPPDQYQ